MLSNRKPLDMRHRRGASGWRSESVRRIGLVYSDSALAMLAVRLVRCALSSSICVFASILVSTGDSPPAIV